MTTKQEAFNQIVELLAVVLEVEAPKGFNPNDIVSVVEGLLSEIDDLRGNVENLSYEVGELSSNARDLERSADSLDFDTVQEKAQEILELLK